MTRNSRVFGFTIVELVVVIILLGILAATALPRFMDVDDQAHAAALKGVQGGLQTGISLYHAQWMAEGQAGPDSAINEFDDLRVNAAGYPYGTGDNSGGSSTVTTSANCQEIFTGLLQAGAPSITNEATVAAVVDSASEFTAVVAVPNCDYYYTAKDNTSGATISKLTYNSVTGLVSSSPVTLP